MDLLIHKDLKAYYHSFLPKSIAQNGDQNRMIHTYIHAISGFTARLTESEVHEMAKKEGFLRARPSKVLQILTTHTPYFLGLQQGSASLWNITNMGNGVIIGLIDTGITAEHISFKDNGISPPPSKWKGSCEDFKAIHGNCNNKLIGARLLNKYTGETIADMVGHGTHTAATATGNFADNANVFGNANGTASGMAPHAHLAVYKVCTIYGCREEDVIAGIDAAIEDGVDVISISLGAQSVAFYNDGIAISAFNAVKKGIFVSCAAGNSGPNEWTIENGAPWLLTVAASTIDRRIQSIVKLGDGSVLEGETVFQPNNYSSTLLPLSYPTTSNFSKEDNCYDGYLEDIKGKIVLCQVGKGRRIPTGIHVKNNGGAAMILMNKRSYGYTTIADAHVLPASHVSYADGEKIASYFNSTPNATAAIIFKGTIIGKSEAPTVAFFSSRGPSTQSPGVLKPDIIGPGVNILAAWGVQTGEDVPTNKIFNIISGTSMATPHLSGIVALIKEKHPDWSPAAIKSAIMTTSVIEDHDGKPIMDEQRQPASFFMMGAGNVNPSKAVDPGLVFDIDTKQYIAFLCGLGYDDIQMRTITGEDIQCSKIKKISQSNLNYPSIVVSLEKNVTVNRTVTNVGKAISSYKVEVDMPDEVIVEVVPKVLEFHELNEKVSYMVSIKSSVALKKEIQGNIRWVADKYIVRTPIIIR
ncbi:subtilisin-like protease 4 [Dioscorea cayenensis subsp. rotundata]|uniref:Subtilisin-like protease 4 n=1 Tax=Dioscorea cayennensis subsp. rotundata TaxID=55577 RepID=A0AB40CGA2_DIOCR|nr:subtilisin-like protease 4 [Dioscorea cayenensis subsp. rotundata]